MRTKIITLKIKEWGLANQNQPHSTCWGCRFSSRLTRLVIDYHSQLATAKLFILAVLPAGWWEDYLAAQRQTVPMYCRLKDVRAFMDKVLVQEWWNHIVILCLSNSQTALLWNKVFHVTNINLKICNKKNKRFQKETFKLGEQAY